MPTRKTRKATGSQSVEINRASKGGADVSNYDGTANTGAGSVPEQRLEVEGPAVVIDGNT